MTEPTRLTYTRSGRTVVLELPAGADWLPVLERCGQEFERADAEADARYREIQKRNAKKEAA